MQVCELSFNVHVQICEQGQSCVPLAVFVPLLLPGGKKGNTEVLGGARKRAMVGIRAGYRHGFLESIRFEYYKYKYYNLFIIFIFIIL